MSDRVLSEIPRKRMRLLKWTRQKRGTLHGFADIELPSGLKIYGCPVHVAVNGRTWAGLPGRPQIDRDDRLIRQDGRAQYTRILEWNTRELGNWFSDALIELVRAQHPDAFAPDFVEAAVSPE
jgi:hypothetical protein